MTKKAQKLIAELKKLPEEEQEKLAASVLEALRQRKEREEVSEEDPYSWLKVLRNAKLSGPEDASVTYEQKLPEEQQDEAVDSLLNRLKALCKIGARPLTEMVGAGTGLYESPEQVDDDIRKQRKEWDY